MRSRRPGPRSRLRSRAATRWVDELAEQAAAALPREVYDYFRQGAGTHHALHEATPAWDALRLHPRVLRDVTSVRTATTVLGTPVDTPVLVAPTAAQHVVAPGGAVATAFGAAKAGSLVCVSCLTNQPYTEIRDTGAPWWAQVYVLRDRGLTRDLVARAEAAGAAALVLTVDTPVVGDRPHPGPGSDAPWYGGRLLPTAVPGDVAVPTATALPGIARALAGTGAETYVDGGLRSGVHVLAALALGARAVLLGRPVLWALATGGADNVQRLLSTVTAELRHAMTLVGARSPDEITPDLAGPVDTAGAQPPG
ncbi:alpha-hydroxy-acid oxidizing protein [Parafrankia sp. Ea1.12]|uniref:alpha-hydroxy-acid oxidizing protein n=1 Tax=Parafrankia sp. Ea1.12 TaxID=573499 RepID=UPI000DD44BCB